MLINKNRWIMQDHADRQANMITKMEVAEITNIYPHKDEYPANKDFVICDLKIRDLDQDPENENERCVYQKCNVLQRGIGNHWGNHWMPKQGDLVLIDRPVNSDTVIILGQLYNESQEPVVTSYDDDYNVSSVDKWIQHEQPTKWPEGTSAKKNFLNKEYKEPAERDHPTCRPVCKKTFSKNRDTINVAGCDHGFNGRDPKCKQCIRTGYIQAPEVAVIRTNSKETTNQDGSGRDESKPHYEKARRWQLFHHCGSRLTFDDDGLIVLQESIYTGSDEDITQIDQGYIEITPTGQVHCKSVNVDTNDKGAESHLYAPKDNVTDETDTISVNLKDLYTDSRIRIYKDGQIKIASCTKGDSIKSHILLKPDGTCVVQNDKANATIVIASDGTISLNSPNHINLTAGIDITLNAPDIYLNGTIHPLACTLKDTTG